MATYGNSFEQVIGLVTAGSEIMQGRSAQVARGLNTISANIVANKDALAAYGIEVEATDGSLKATFDVLSELKPLWDTMTDSERQALGVTLAGKNQYRVLASIMQNFAHAQEATTTALNASGSAMRENTAYMESLQAQTQLLKADFQTLANNVITKEFVSNLLSVADAFLKLADTPIGRFVTQVLLLTGIGWGATSLINASRVLTVVQQQFAALSGIASATTISLSTMLPVVLGISGALVGIVTVIKAIEKAREEADPINKITKDIGVLNEAISKVSDYEKTEDLIKRYEELRNKTKLTAEESQELVSIRDKLVSNADGYIDAELDIGAQLDYQVGRYKELIELQKEYEKNRILGELGDGSGYVGAIGQRAVAQAQLTRAQQAYNEAVRISVDADGSYKEALEEEYNTLQSVTTLTDEQKDRLYVLEKALYETEHTIKTFPDTISKLKGEISEANSSISEFEKTLFTAIKDGTISLMDAVALLGDNIPDLTYKYGQWASQGIKVKSTTDDLANATENADDKVLGYINTLSQTTTTSDTLRQSLGKLAWQMFETNKANMSMDAQIQALKNLLLLTGANIDAQNNLKRAIVKPGAVPTPDLTDTGTGTEYGRYYNWALSLFGEIPTVAEPEDTGGGRKDYGSTTTTDKRLEKYKADVELLKAELALMKERGDSEEDQIAIMRKIQKALHIEANYLRTIEGESANVKALSQEWWSIENDIADILENRIAEALKEANAEHAEAVKQRQEELEQQKQALSALQDKMQDYYQDQIDAIDAQIDGLKKANDEIEEQISLQEKLDALARARQQKVLVYKDGRWQYIGDADAVSAAAQDLAEFKRQQALQDEIDKLEAQKSVLEGLKDTWGDLTKAYDDAQADWLISQQFGIDTAVAGWEKLIGAAEAYAQIYNQIMGAEANLAKASEANPKYDASVDYAQKILDSTTYDEALMWANMRNAKMAGEGLDPSQYGSTSDYLARWTADNGGNMSYTASGAVLTAEMSKKHYASQGTGHFIPNEVPAASFDGDFGNKNVTIQALNLPNVTDGAGFVEYMKSTFFSDVLEYSH